MESYHNVALECNFKADTLKLTVDLVNKKKSDTSHT